MNIDISYNIEANSIYSRIGNILKMPDIPGPVGGNGIGIAGYMNITGLNKVSYGPETTLNLPAETDFRTAFPTGYARMPLNTSYDPNPITFMFYDPSTNTFSPWTLKYEYIDADMLINDPNLNSGQVIMFYWEDGQGHKPSTDGDPSLVGLYNQSGIEYYCGSYNFYFCPFIEGFAYCPWYNGGIIVAQLGYCIGTTRRRSQGGTIRLYQEVIYPVIGRPTNRNPDKSRAEMPYMYTPLPDLDPAVKKRKIFGCTNWVRLAQDVEESITEYYIDNWKPNYDVTRETNIIV